MPAAGAAALDQFTVAPKKGGTVIRAAGVRSVVMRDQNVSVGLLQNFGERAKRLCQQLEDGWLICQVRADD